MVVSSFRILEKLNGLGEIASELKVTAFIKGAKEIVATFIKETDCLAVAKYRVAYKKFAVLILISCYILYFRGWATGGRGPWGQHRASLYHLLRWPDLALPT